MTVAPGTLPDSFDRIVQSIPPHVTLVAVTKFQPAETIRAAYDRGLRHFGESRVQEAIAKQAELTDLPDITWHLIGALQSNKARKAVEHFDWIHSVDSLKLAQRLDAIAGELGRTPQCCLQVKIVPDPPKSGIDLADLEALLPDFDQLAHLKIRGLMAIPPQGASDAVVQQVFTGARALGDRINAADYDRLHIDQLSLGMSGDYEIAIACEATMVRLGTVLFGPRPGA